MDTYNLAAFNPNLDVSQIHHAMHYGFTCRPRLNFGAAKLVARCTQIALTRKGSDRTDPEAGCYLIEMVARHHASEAQFIRSEITSALDDVLVQMLHENDPSSSAESQLLTLHCVNVEIIDDKVCVHLQLTSRANTRINFLLPIAIN